eukprot:TRINITY_DN58226_c0_g1_i1.p1 TRINITY_DN58226_c0_g1~~TRINITY_DN58226_c0_g1_i1.p1  ORF type:complete len:381 (+),score=42.27 TRINITY_DN58226_c0_g1_i1:134-1276(+)
MKVQLRIVNLAGETVCCISMFPEETVANVKRHVNEHGGPPVTLQTLCFEDRELADTEVVSSLVSSVDEDIELRLIVDSIDLDACIDALMTLNPGSRQISSFIDIDMINKLCTKARRVFLLEPMLLELEAPVTICGNICGHFSELLRIFELGGLPSHTNYLFLGGYVNKGRYGLEVLVLLLAYKLKYSDTMHLLRGADECMSICRIYGFYDQAKRAYNVKVWKLFCEVFNCMPICALVGSKIMCVHGSLSPELEHFDQIRSLQRPTVVPESGILCDLLWSDPDHLVSGWADNDRGVSWTFGADVVSHFVDRFELDLICRAHQVEEDGYAYFAEGKLVTLFSAAGYKGSCDNKGAIMIVDEALQRSFACIEPSWFASSVSAV